MISIIISSVSKQQLDAVSQNIANTIGVPYEIIATDNGKGQQGICAVYNRAARLAKYDILCFMHEDIILETCDWGLVVSNCFAGNPLLGLLGVVGSSYKTLMPSGWVCYGLDSVLHYHILQSYKRSNQPTSLQYNNLNNEKLSKVACIDGVWFCTTKKVMETCRFDEELLTGFHCYDIDFSLTVNQEYEAAVTYDVSLNHLSEGDFSAGWAADTLKLHKKWQHMLPLNIAGVSRKQKLKMEWLTFKVFVGQMVTLKLSPLKYRNIFMRRVISKLGPVFALRMYHRLIKKSI